MARAKSINHVLVAMLLHCFPCVHDVAIANDGATPNPDIATLREVCYITPFKCQSLKLARYVVAL